MIECSSKLTEEDIKAAEEKNSCCAETQIFVL